MMEVIPGVIQFNKRLKFLREDSGLSQSELAKLIQISKSSINMYERGEREPKFETLEIIADYFNVSIGYLLGQSNQEYFLKSEECSDFKNRFKLLCKDRNLTYYKVSIDCHFDKSYISRWLNKNYLPSLELLEILSEYFNVSIDYLLGRAYD